MQKAAKCYDNNSASCAKYGRLYNWEAAKKACPSGWHLPNNEDELFKYIGNDDIIVIKKLKAKSGWNNKENGESGNGTDDFGFSALPGGAGSPTDISGAGDFGSWWWDIGEKTWSETWSITADGDDIIMTTADNDSWLSVRCVKN